MYHCKANFSESKIVFILKLIHLDRTLLSIKDKINFLSELSVVYKIYYFQLNVIKLFHFTIFVIII